ncbi:hypothetical protein AEQ67_14680 [Pseudomonas sp. RIT-PI-q]|uniref:hypothetical protein n=1 Tax=Pseudomonas sp. RIT-PI-q TaxID=1690247 RepID=UPI0006CDCFC5|nr:hypothetical protein [Pseudomonas sp. RIT-PI-q]KPG98574.1 hypothetical protein AEQ67_14680 [Pseudomonas sp. RIT-PI-q]
MDQTIDLASIVEDNEQTVLGKKVLFVPLKKGSNSEKLLIVMSAHNQGSKYMALRSFLENQICDLLFISDPKNSWYLDEDNGETFLKTIKLFADAYAPHAVFLFGSSMSGYGAILHAFKLNANAIASNPQVNLDITKDYAWPELIDHINEIGGHHTNLDEIANLEWNDSAVYVIHGHDDIDIINVELLSRATPPNKKLIIQTLDIDSHIMFFGKEVDYIYNVMDLLFKFRTDLDLKKILAQLMPEDKTNKRQLRAERNNTKISDPFRTIDHSGATVPWQNRYLFQQIGKQVFFSNIGFYCNSQLTGGTCFFDGERWRLCSPMPSINDNLIAKNTLRLEETISQPSNNQNINDFWWIRNQSDSEIAIEGEHNLLKVCLTPNNTKNIYLSSSVSADKNLHDSIAGKYLTLSADVFTSEGDIYLTLGGVGESGYHHKNSSKNTPGSWKHVSVTEQFLSINSSHKDSIFVRVNLAADGKAKTVQIKNLSLQVGYFPMGLA